MKRLVASTENLKDNFTIDLSLLFVEKDNEISLNEHYFNTISKMYKDLICDHIKSEMSTLCSNIKAHSENDVKGLIQESDIFPDRYFFELGKELDNINNYNEDLTIKSIGDLRRLFRFMNKNVRSFFTNDIYDVLSTK